MTSDNTGEIIMWFIFGAIAHYFILVWIIGSTTHSGKKIKYDEIKIKLLMKIAEKQGVSKEEINDIVK